MDRKPQRKRANREAFVPPAFLLLPKELTTEILARVAASSPTDFFNAKLSCKFLDEVAEDDYIYRHMSLGKFNFGLWEIRREANNFYNTCKRSGNPEALYREGVIQYFNIRSRSVEVGLDYLKKAASFGHPEASYILGIVHVCNGEENKGWELLSRITTRSELRKCRNKLCHILRTMWLPRRKYILLEPAHQFYCPLQHQSKKRGWTTESDDDDDDEDEPCKRCMWNREIYYVCNMLCGVWNCCTLHPNFMVSG